MLRGEVIIADEMKGDKLQTGKKIQSLMEKNRVYTWREKNEKEISDLHKSTIFPILLLLQILKSGKINLW